MVDEQDAVTDFEPSIESLKVEKVIIKWSDEPEIEWDATITLAHMSKLAYEDGTTRQRRLNELGFDQVKLLDDGPRSGFVAMSDEVAVVAFRGTDDPEDWIANFTWDQLADSQSDREVHTGFWGEYKVFAQAVRDSLDDRAPKRIWITGHSLGGAMAACCAYDFLQKEAPLAGVVTFGQPRIGNEALAKFLDVELGDRYLRLMNHGDPVVILPPGTGRLIPSYWHSGRRAWFLAGQLFANQGPTPYSQPAPDEGAALDEPYDLAETTAEDKTPSMTDEEFLELQRELQAKPSNHEMVESPLVGTPPPLGAAPPTEMRGVLSSVVGFFRARIGEHNMDEYLRQLNDFRRNEANQ